jgi:hypothetical protein
MHGRGRGAEQMAHDLPARRVVAGPVAFGASPIKHGPDLAEVLGCGAARHAPERGQDDFGIDPGQRD